MFYSLFIFVIWISVINILYMFHHPSIVIHFSRGRSVSDNGSQRGPDCRCALVIHLLTPLMRSVTLEDKTPMNVCVGVG